MMRGTASGFSGLSSTTKYPNTRWKPNGYASRFSVQSRTHHWPLAPRCGGTLGLFSRRLWAGAMCSSRKARDENAIKQLGSTALDNHGLAKMPPSELANHIQRRQNSGGYCPASLAETGSAVGDAVPSNSTRIQWRSRCNHRQPCRESRSTEGSAWQAGRMKTAVVRVTSRVRRASGAFRSRTTANVNVSSDRAASALASRLNRILPGGCIGDGSAARRNPAFQTLVIFPTGSP